MTEPTETTPVLVVGGGPAGLAAAEAAAQAGARVLVAEKMPSLGRKLLMAGKSGLNLTNAAPDAEAPRRYGAAAERLAPALAAFPPSAVVAWAEALGQPCVVGSSGRVFPLAMKASPLLRAWLARLAGLGVTARTGWRLVGLAPGRARFETADGVREVRADAIVLALGGASWPRLGSDGAWPALIDGLKDGLPAGLGAPVRPFSASNVGWEAAWSAPFRARFVGRPLKGVRLSIGDASSRAEAVVTAYGLEGGALYALGPALRAHAEHEPLRIDLAPDRDAATLAAALERAPARASLSNRLRRAGLDDLAASLLREAGEPPRETRALAARLKATPLRLTGPRPIAEAISTAGGLALEALDPSYGVAGAPGLFAAGEMLDWDAPTGGWLLTACLATGRAAGRAAAAFASEAPCSTRDSAA